MGSSTNPFFVAVICTTIPPIWNKYSCTMRTRTIGFSAGIGTAITMVIIIPGVALGIGLSTSSEISRQIVSIASGNSTGSGFLLSYFVARCVIMKFSKQREGQAAIQR